MDKTLLDTFEGWMIRYQADRNPAPNTLKGLRSTMTRFLTYCQAKGRENLNMIIRDDVVEWLSSLVDVRTSTRKEAERHITLFFNRAVVYGVRAAKLPEIGYRGPADEPRAVLKGFSAAERITMMQNVKKLGNRERVIFYLLSQRPMRQQELLNLQVGHVNLEAKTITILRSKNKSSRVISIPAEAQEPLAELVKGKDGEEYMFPIANRTMNTVINDIIEVLGVHRQGRSSHAFRHTVIVQMLRTLRMDPATIGEIAGNSAKTIYEHYDKDVSYDELRHAESQMDALARGKIKEGRV